MSGGWTRRVGSAIGTMFAVVLLASLGLPVEPAAAAHPSQLPELQCDVPVTTSVKLSADLTCSTPVIVPENTPALTVDLGGHTLKVDPVPVCFTPYPSCSFVDRSDSATLKNGTVDGTVGASDGYGPGPGTAVSNVHVTGLVHTGLYGALVLRHDIVDGGIVDLHYMSIRDSVIAGGIRIADADAGTPIDIVGNRITGGISIYDQFDFDLVGGTIAQNVIQGSSGAGISISGIGTSSMGHLDITGNTIVGNAGDGVSYVQSIQYCCRFPNGPITVTKNVMRDNGGHGFEAVETFRRGPVSGIVDGGGNRARGNALDPQCVVIRCGPIDSREIPFVSWPMPPNVSADGALGPDQLDATSPVPGTFTYSPAAGTVLAPGPWNLSVHFVPDDLARYQPVDRAVSVFVQAPVPVGTTITWPTPAAVPYGTPLGPDQLDATASTPGTFTYTPVAGTVLPVGSHQLSVSFVPDDPVHHTSATTTVTLDVQLPPDQTLTWTNPAPIVFGTPLGPDQLDAVSSVPGTLTYDPPSGTVLQVGGHQLTATFTPDDPVHHSPLTATVTVVVFPATGMITFEPPMEVLRGFIDIPTDVDLADLDGDGHEDVVSAAPSLFSAPGNLSVNLGRGDGTFAAPGLVIPLGDGGHAVAVGDVDGDGHPDLVASNGSTQTISVLLGVGDGTFAPAVDIAAGTGQGDIQLADLDGDGNPDVVESNFTSASVTVLLGDGHGGFGPKADYAVGGAPMKMAIADLDGDGMPDVTVANYLSNTVSVLDGHGDGTLAPKRELAVGTGPTSVVAADLDHDGALDLVTTDATDGTLSIRRGDGSGGFLPRTTVAAGQGVRALTVGEVDGDGEPDLIATNVSGWVSIWTATGSATPDPRVDVAVGPDARALAVGDLDGDHRVDLVVGRPFALRLTVLLNRTSPAP